MREVKFRGKRKDNGEWVYGSLQTYSDGEYFINIDENGWQVDPETVGQFTGLKDKNGKEIYEGDICKETCEYIIDNKPSEDGWTAHTLPIEFHDGGFFFGYHTTELSYFIRGWGLEVIGNIHENPELLKQEDKKERKLK